MLKVMMKRFLCFRENVEIFVQKETWGMQCHWCHRLQRVDIKWKGKGIYWIHNPACPAPHNKLVLVPQQSISTWCHKERWMVLSNELRKQELRLRKVEKQAGHALFNDFICHSIIFHNILVFLSNLLHGFVYALHTNSQCDLLCLGTPLV